ncbi:nucleotidyltransferase family protein [Kozakia baliensis]|uniref:nucleotidyltransferase family protein n=1 Tax=Kozakia baliensis TaxID=153496 RepID=UPI00345C211E
MTLPTLVLAGSRDGAQDPLARLGGVAHKALLPVVGTPMILRVLNTLRATPGLGPMAVSIENPDAIRPLIGDAMILPTAKGPSGSVAIALERLGAPLLVTTADHPLLRTEWIAQFLMGAEGKCDLAVAVANRTVIERDVPGTKRTYIRLRELQFSGCNLFWLGTIKARRVVELWQKLERDRKKPWRMAATLGWGILLRAVTGRLTRDALYRRIKKLTGAKVLLIELSDGRAAVDVDKPSDLALVEKILTHS